MRHLPLSLLLLAAALAPCRMDAVTFSGLGDVVGGAFSSNAQAISNDGFTVVGQGTGGANTAFVWTQAAGMKPLYNTNTIGIAYKVTADGKIAVGRDDNNGARAFRYTVGSGFTVPPYVGGLNPNGSPPNQGRSWSVSNDGSVVVGSVASPASTGGEQAFIYTGGTLSGIGFLGSQSGNPYSEAHDVSGDGSVLVGFSSSSAGQSAFRYTTAGGMTDLGRFAGDTSNYRANAISTNGNVIVGQASGNKPFTWTQGGGMLTLASLSSAGNPLDVNFDGSVIVGSDKLATDSNTSAVFWLNGTEYNLKNYLLAQGNTGVVGWDLRLATGISADGYTICGTGIDPSGNLEAFIVNIQAVPEPAAFAPILLALAGGLAWRKRRNA